MFFPTSSVKVVLLHCFLFSLCCHASDCLEIRGLLPSRAVEVGLRVVLGRTGSTLQLFQILELILKRRFRIETGVP